MYRYPIIIYMYNYYVCKIIYKESLPNGLF